MKYQNTKQRCVNSDVAHAYLCNKKDNTRRERTIVSSRAWDLPSLVYAANPEVRRGRREASSRRASVALLEDRSVYVPPTLKPPLPSHRVCCAPGQVRRAAWTGQSLTWNLYIRAHSATKSCDLFRNLLVSSTLIKLNLNF